MNATSKSTQVISSGTFLLTHTQRQPRKRNLRLLSGWFTLFSRERLGGKTAFVQLLRKCNTSLFTWLTSTQEEYEASKMASLQTTLAEKSNDKNHTESQGKGGGILESLATMHSAMSATPPLKLHEKNNDTEQCRWFKTVRSIIHVSNTFNSQ